MNNANTIKEFTDLKAWQENHKFVIMIYKILKRYPREEMFALCDQMRRASVSITSNIAEGFGRQSLKEKIQFYYLAQGSLTEIKNQLILSRDVKYLTQTEYINLENQLKIGHQLLQGLITKTKSFLLES